jgi:hypothetical protein
VAVLDLLAVALNESVDDSVAGGVLDVVGEGSSEAARRQGSATPPAAAVAGTAVSPFQLLPQHATAPPADRAHVWVYPAATATWTPPATLPGTAV